MNPLGGFSYDDARVIHQRVLGQQFAQKPLDTARHQTIENKGYYVLLSEDLAAATDELTGYSQAEATVIKYVPSVDSLDMEEATTTDGTITVTNRNRNFSALAGDLLYVTRHIAEWVPFTLSSNGLSPIRFEIREADCEARSAIVRVLSRKGSVPDEYEIPGETELNEAGETINSKFVVVYDKTGCYLNESNANLLNRIGHATYLTGAPKYAYQPWTCFEIIALAEQQTECEAF